MGPLAATLLCYFEPERVYASLVRLHDAYQMLDDEPITPKRQKRKIAADMDAKKGA